MTAARTPAAGAMDRLEADFQAFARGAGAAEPAFLRSLRRAAFDSFAARGFPSTREEEWRFTDVSPLTTATFAVAKAGRNGTGPDAVAPSAHPGAHRLTFVDGQFRADLSAVGDLPAGAFAGPLRRALAERPELLEQHLGRHAAYEDQAFVALCTALGHDAAVVHIPAGAEMARPIQVLFLGRSGPRSAAYPRVLVVADEGSRGRIIETYAAADGGRYFTGPVTEVAVGPGAAVDHYKLQTESRAAFHVGTLQAVLGRDAGFTSHSISTGGSLVRHDVRARLEGEGAEAVLNGLYVVEGEQFVDTHMLVEHLKPHGTSHELYKGILDGRAHGVFNGRIYVAPGAQVTDAVQSNRNILLSRSALVHSNPQLEIFADDVRCTHGSTVGQLDPEAVFYLRSRGLGPEAARSLLVYAFAQEVIGGIADDDIRTRLQEFLFSRLPRGDVVREAV
ncbi:MAG: Fe-S cluster assembly protein SufD [Anaerolineae bacterium]